jgi:endonuclease III
MDDYPIETVLQVLDKVYPYHPMGDVTNREPFKVLICCLLSLRSRDVITMPACTRLFREADTPEEIIDMPKEKLVELIYPVKFYYHKADVLKEVSQELLERFDGQVPDEVEVLDTIKGVGRKTANLVVSLGYGKPAICVDTHVHRICNRLGYVKTRTPDETEQVLRQKLPLRYWNMINRVMVRHGQEICRPLTPLCPECPVNAYCQKVGVGSVAQSRKTSKSAYPTQKGDMFSP